MDGERKISEPLLVRGVAATVGWGLLVASMVGLTVGWFAEWGSSPDARWLGNTGWLVALSLLHALLLFTVMVDGDRLTPVHTIAAGAVLLVLAVGCGWAVATGNTPYPAGTRWPIVVASAGVGIVGTLLLCWSNRGRRRAPWRAAILLVTAVVAVVAIWVPAGRWRDAINIESVTTDAALTDAVRGPLRYEPIWSHHYDGVVNVVASPSGVFVATATRVVGLDPVTGERRWSYGDAGSSGLRVFADPSGRTVAAEDDSGLVLFDALTGEVRSRLDLPSPAAIGARALVFTPDEFTLLVRDHSGARVWRQGISPGCRIAFDPLGRDSIVVHHDRVFVPAYCPQGARVFSFDGANGNDQISVPVADDQSPDCFALASAPDAVAVRTCPDPSADAPQGAVNEVRLLDHRDLDLVWRAELGQWPSPSGQAYLTADSRGVYTDGEGCDTLILVRAAGTLGDTTELPEGDCPRSVWMSRGVMIVTQFRAVMGLR